MRKWRYSADRRHIYGRESDVEYFAASEGCQECQLFFMLKLVRRWEVMGRGLLLLQGAKWHCARGNCARDRL